MIQVSRGSVRRGSIWRSIKSCDANPSGCREASIQTGSELVCLVQEEYHFNLVVYCLVTLCCSAMCPLKHRPDHSRLFTMKTCGLFDLQRANQANLKQKLYKYMDPCICRVRTATAWCTFTFPFFFDKRAFAITTTFRPTNKPIARTTRAKSNHCHIVSSTWAHFG